MRTLKQIFTYLIWTVLALLLGMVYMRVVLGFNDASTEGVSYLFYIIYNLGLLHIGTRIGGVIALLFILLDVFVLKKKLKNNSKRTLIRLGWLLLISLIAGSIHYILEKIIDVI